MPNHVIATGNLGDAPTLKHVPIAGDTRIVAEMRIFVDEYRRNEGGDYEQVGGFWANCSIWGSRAEHAAKLLRKGARVRVEGTLSIQTWIDKETDEEKSAIHINADDVFLSLARIESVEFRPPQQRDGASEFPPDKTTTPANNKKPKGKRD